jgi:hypothetical protein
MANKTFTFDCRLMVSQFSRRTPPSNTGLNVQFFKTTVKMDWLQGVLSLTSQEFLTFTNEFSLTFADTFASDDGYFFSGRKFDHHRRSGRGSVIAWNILKFNDDWTDRHFLDEKTYDVWFTAPAKFLDACDSFFMLKRFFQFLSEWKVKMTRIDIACDDYSKSLPPVVLLEAIEKKLNHGFQRWRTVKSDDGGFTIYFGSVGSDRMIRYYDKSVESDGEIDAYRFEVVLKDGYATSLWDMILKVFSFTSNHEDCLRELLSSVALNSIDFYSHEKEDDRRSPKIYEQWWLDFKALFDCSELKVRMDRTKTTIDKTCEWIELQVETSLAMIENFYNRTSQDFAEWFNARLESGRTRLTNFHLNKVESQICYNDAMDGFF